MATSPQAAIACYPSLAMMGHSWVRVVRRICIPKCQARLWPGRTFHVKRRLPFGLGGSRGTRGAMAMTSQSVSLTPILPNAVGEYTLIA